MATGIPLASAIGRARTLHAAHGWNTDPAYVQGVCETLAALYPSQTREQDERARDIYWRMISDDWTNTPLDHVEDLAPWERRPVQA